MVNPTKQVLKENILTITNGKHKYKKNEDIISGLVSSYTIDDKTETIKKFPILYKILYGSKYLNR
jgi:hypothetical protein